MLRSGKVHWLTVAGTLAVVAVLGVFISTSGDSPQSRASIFMAALATGDAKTLTESSKSEKISDADLLKKWEESLAYGKHYVFKYKITGMSSPSPDTATVKMMVERNYLSGGYQENFELNLKKYDGRWKVRMDGISRALYPFLPRG